MKIKNEFKNSTITHHNKCNGVCDLLIDKVTMYLVEDNCESYKMHTLTEFTNRVHELIEDHGIDAVNQGVQRSAKPEKVREFCCSGEGSHGIFFKSDKSQEIFEFLLCSA